jgi:hypothetical protein
MSAALPIAALAALAAAGALSRAGSRARRSALPRHLRFLDGLLGARHKGLATYFPETARGTLQPGPGERWFSADGIRYLGDTDGTMVPIDAEQLEPMPENIFSAPKLSALVEAIQAGENPGVQPGYADLTVEGGALSAQVRDGNHRTFAPILAGGAMSWVMMSDSTRQDLDQRTPGSEALYRSIRAAQRAAGAPLFVRRSTSKIRGERKDVDLLASMEQRRLELEAVERDYVTKMLHKWGPAERTGFTLTEQLERPQLFWRMRLGELKDAHGPDWVYTQVYQAPEHDAVGAAATERAKQFPIIYDLRKKLGLQIGERLDPITRKPVEDR